MQEANGIRIATAADRPGVERCVQLAYNPYIDDTGKAPAPMLDDYGDLIARRVVRVADAGGEVVGLIVMWAEPDHFYIDNIAVDPSQQSLGLGARLLDAAEAAARAADPKRDPPLHQRSNDLEHRLLPATRVRRDPPSNDRRLLPSPLLPINRWSRMTSLQAKPVWDVSGW